MDTLTPDTPARERSSLWPHPPRARSRRRELIDDPGLMGGDAVAAMADLVRINRLLGGRAALQRPLDRLLSTSVLGPRVTVLDVGCGVADLTGLVLRLGRRHHLDVRVIGLDRFPAVLRMARHRERRRDRRDDGRTYGLVAADALRLPLRDDAVDIAYCATTLHHFDPPAAERLLTEMGRVARAAVVVTDLRRGWASWWGARLLLPLLRVGPVTRHDGMLSTARAYTAAEVRRLAAGAGLAAVSVHDRLGHRLELVGRPAC